MVKQTSKRGANLLKKKYYLKGIISLLMVVILVLGGIAGCKKDDSKEKDVTTVSDNKDENDTSDIDDTDNTDDTDKSDDTSKSDETSEGDTTLEGDTKEDDSTEDGSTKDGTTNSSINNNTNNNNNANSNTTSSNNTKNNTTTQATTKSGTSNNTDSTIKGTAISKRVSVHDPSIIVGTDNSGKKCYYIFGSHLAFAKSYDLQNWTTFTNNINRDYRTLFAKAFDWSDNGDSQYDPAGNMWAPDVIYNTTMKKWCMYMSINGRSWNSSIVLLTADSLEGNWTYVGEVVYSGFTDSATYSYTQTDYVKATGDTNFSRKLTYNVTSGRQWINGVTASSTWNASTGPHAIDPSVTYDANGKLWMCYGSWSGGIWIFELDESTGLRDYKVKYATSDNMSNPTTDPYFGKKISGAVGAQGEGAYIVYDKDAGYYYLYVSYGWLGVDGGYQIRLFRSKNIDGTYTDFDGTRANATGSNRDGIGIKLMGNYTFSSLSTNTANAQKGYKSPGHNSAFIDSDGSRYLIYHTRFNLGNEWHAVRVHQQFLNEDGWLVTAVYENLGSKISTTGYTMNEMAGKYEMVNMGTSSLTANVGMLSTQSITLNADGTMSGSMTGTWTYNKQYVTLKTSAGNTYKGVFFKQFNESKNHEEVMTFTVIGHDTSIWGTK